METVEKSVSRPSKVYAKSKKKTEIKEEAHEPGAI